MGIGISSFRRSHVRIAVAFALAAIGSGANAGEPVEAKYIAPATYRFSNGLELRASGNLAYDYNDFSGEAYDGAQLTDEDGFRRKEFGVTLAKKGVFEATVNYEFQADVWQDVSLRVETKALSGHDWGKLRIGQSKTPVGFEGVTATRAGSFLEQSLATQAIFEGRRLGVDWALERPSYLVNAGYYFRSDLEGNNKGDTLAARSAWTPLKSETQVLHLGAAASVEQPDGEVNGRGIALAPSVRWRARPEAGLTDLRLVDSGTLTNVDSIERVGLEGLWIQGPWSVQGEYLRQRTQRDGGSDYATDGYYLFGSWLVTGESRRYSGGNVANPRPSGRYGALELLARYSHLDLDDAGIAGGRQSDWTLGANWYFSDYFKLQANYVDVDARRAGLDADPDIFEVRAQLQF
ncbi:porin [Lysobacter arenosi]|uniref:Porin n=1 Tax=Lysobacter arenosi TaxID=2795387 RepID=A0ABX7RFV8_9GAMM|nr:porin [Lysobacter arenosi]QSX76294.1 porin [Lysobacter arenosi]